MATEREREREYKNCKQDEEFFLIRWMSDTKRREMLGKSASERDVATLKKMNKQQNQQQKKKTKKCLCINIYSYFSLGSAKRNLS